MSKEFTVHLTGPNRFDLWMFVYRLDGVKATTKDQVRNLEAVCETFHIADVEADVQERIAAKLEGTISGKDFADVECPTGSVDLKRLYDYLETMPEKAPVDLKLRLLKLADYLQDVKDKRPRLAEVPESSG